MPQDKISFYSSSGFSDWEIGDITVIKHDNKYHLFHLIIPNHDYIAHAVSHDGISWHRVKNALFVGDPGEWDDDMLWTMHVCEVNGVFEMYYTGLHRQDRGVVSRVGLAISKDLFNWEKASTGIFPFESKGPYYEDLENNPRNWLSFRDPFRYDYQGNVYFLICARASSGLVSRRGCIGLVRQINDHLEYLSPLHYPMVYDDLECPCVFELSGRHYILGSIREDIKVRYWFAPDFLEEYHCFHNNVLLPQGNYAARITRDGDHILVYTFFYTHGSIDSLRILPPPKELDTDRDGRLILKTYYKWNEKRIGTTSHDHSATWVKMFNNPTASICKIDDGWTFSSRSGHELFCIRRPSDSFIWEGELTIEGMGKLGLLSDLDHEGNGYFYSLDPVNGYMQVSAWGFNPNNNKNNFIYLNLQDNTFAIDPSGTYQFSLLRHGSYMELSINGVVKLTLVDFLYNGQMLGIYSSSSSISLKKSSISILPDPISEYLVEESEITKY